MKDGRHDLDRASFLVRWQRQMHLGQRGDERRH